MLTKNEVGQENVNVSVSVNMRVPSQKKGIP